MDLYFLFIQFIGVVAWLMLILSYYRSDTNKILMFQIIATCLYSVHYYLLGAYSGLFICLFDVFRDFLYYKTDKDDYIYKCCIPIYILLAFISYNTIIDILPYCSSLLDGYSLTKKRRVVVIGAIVSYSLWGIYGVFVKSYSGVITDSLIVLSNVWILFRESRFYDKYFLKKG